MGLDKMGYMSDQEKALFYQEVMRPYAEKAEKEAQEMLENLKIIIPKIYDDIPRHGLTNRIKRYLLKMADA